MLAQPRKPITKEMISVPMNFEYVFVAPTSAFLPKRFIYN